MAQSGDAGTAFVEIEPDVEGFEKKLASKLEPTLKRVGDRMTKVGSEMTKKITLPVAAGLAFATKAASDLGEAQNKTDVVFGKSAKVIHDFSKNSAEDLGQSRRAVLDATGTFGNLFVALKIGQKPAADMSTRLVALASDLASFNNVSPEDALEALRSGLVGETEPLRKFGVNMNDATLKTKALELGLIKSEKDGLTPAAKAQAAYALILEQTSVAQGDFARTSDGLANQSRILKARLEDTAASIGEKLIPVASKVAEVANDMLTAFSELPPEVQNLAIGGAAAAAALGPLVSIIGNTVKAAGGLQKAWEFLGAGGTIATAGAVAGIAAITSGFVKAKIEARELVEELTGGLKTNDFDSLVETLEKTRSRSSELREEFHSYDGLKGILQGTVEILTPLKNKVLDNAEALRAVDDAMAELEGRSIHYQESINILRNELGLSEADAKRLADRTGIDLSDAFNDVIPPLREAYQATQQNSVQAEALAASQETLASKVATSTERLDAFKSALEGTLGIQLSAEAASSAHQEAIDRLTESLAANGNTFDLNTEQGRANAEARRNVISTAGAEVDALARASAATGADANQKQALIDKLNGLKEQFPGLVRQIDGYIGIVNQIPEEKSTTVVAHTAQAQADLDRLIAASRQLQRETHFEPYRAPNLPGAADGGFRPKGWTGWMGERGPEIVTMPADGYVIPNHAIHSKSFDTGGSLRPGWNGVFNGTGAMEDLVPAAAGSGITIEHLEVNNPVPERASESVPRELRRLAYTLS